MTVYIDVDLTLVNISGELLSKVEDRLKEMILKGYELVAWSHGGRQYAETLLTNLNISKYFVAILGKPNFYIDDVPETVLGWADVVRVSGPSFWEDKLDFWSKLFGKRVY